MRKPDGLAAWEHMGMDFFAFKRRNLLKMQGNRTFHRGIGNRCAMALFGLHAVARRIPLL
jgi:hypothetical protein